MSLRAAYALLERELLRFFRQPNRIVGAIGQPVIFWVLLGAAFKGSFKAPGVEETYGQFFLPGVAVMITLFTAIFSTISVIEDRREGFLQGVLVAPVGRSSLVLGKILGGTVLAVLQATLFLLLAPTVGIGLSATALLGAVGVLGLIAFGLTGLGFSIAWRMDSTQGFHAIMSVFLLPLWLLSGSVFPASGAHPALAFVLRLNPLSYGVAALRHALGMGGATPGPLVCLAVSLLFALAMFGLAMRLAARPAKGDLQ
ncbi:MAG: ABC transporter permease [Planctomycetes bacterium]|nr:ABC transporter permease [Planctomycetota bacterium]